MARKKKFPNPEFFRAKTEMDWRAQAANLKEFGSIALELFKETDWRAFAAKQKEHLLDNVARVTREAKTVAAMTGAERMELLKNGEKHLGTLYRKGDMATVRREWRGVESTLIDFSGWLKVWGMLLATFSKDLIPALNTTFWYRWMISYMCCVSFMDKNTMGQRGNALKMSHLMTYDIFRYVAENLVFLAKCDEKNGNSRELNKKVVLFDEMTMGQLMAGFPDLLESCDDTLSMPGKTLQGHLPDMYGPAMSACIAAGVSTDHESFCEKDVFERLRNGCHLMMREGSAARNMPVLLKTVMENHLDTAMVSIVTDDLHTVDLQERGHLDDSLRTALGMGLDFVKAIQMVTVNCARAFNLDREIGGLAPGRRADVNITTGPEDFRVLTTFAGGRQITDNGKLLVHYETAEHEPCVLNTMHLKNPITADSFKIHAPAGAKKVKALVMDTLPYMPFTNRRDVELPVVDGVVQCDVEQDVLYIAQVERHGKNGNVGKAFMGGFHIRGGAMASSVGHDNHNIIVMGDSFEDMALAVNRCVELGGGQVIVRDGKVAAEVAYPICGLLSDLPLDELAEKKKELNRVAHEMGTEIAIPFMFLSFICLAAIPAYAITDCGFIDVVQQKVIDPILEVVE